VIATSIPMTPEAISAWLRQCAPEARLSANSRSIRAGDVFFAFAGQDGGNDGRQYIAQAIEQGAAAILCETRAGSPDHWNHDWTLPHLMVPDLQQQAGFIANLFYGRPDNAMYTIAVTGTNGKTSCALWLATILSRLGEPAAVIGTLGVGVLKSAGSQSFEGTGYTTPDAVQLQGKLEQVRQEGVRSLAIEASSIGLAQGRLNGMHFDVAVLTNLTRDHLDYHGDMEAYRAAKAKLFDWPGLQHAVLNLDDAFGVQLAHDLLSRRAPAARLPVIGYTLGDAHAEGVAVLRASEIRSRHAGTDFRLDSPFGQAQVKTQMVGRFNISNVLAVLAVLLAKGMPLRAAVAAVEQLTPAPGRMQQLGGIDAPMIIVDYAHTPDALEKTLAALRPVAQERGGQLWCVFGCGGDRDPGKRAQMGAIAEAADRVLVTSDNPRSENPQAIIAQIQSGMKVEPQAVEDRAAAILLAVRHASKLDVILVAGKGHETYQEIKGKRLPFSDAEHASLALAARATMMRTD